MKVRLLIKNGYVIDPINNFFGVRDVAIDDGYIINTNVYSQYDNIIDASNKYVFPGLIDFHAHIFPKSTDIGIDADTNMLNQGVTSVVDPGSAGSSNIESFVENVVVKSRMTMKAFINLCPAGLCTMKYHENYNPKYWDEGRLRYYFEKYADILLGLKIRISRPIFGELGFDVFEKAVTLADKLNTRLCVHVTNPVGSIIDVANILRKGDIIAHCFHGTGNTIIGADGKVLNEIKKAQQRGIIMDAANGGNHWNFFVAEAAISDGFYPDVISTDLTCKTLYKDPVFSLPYIMSKYLMLGMPLEKIVKAVTAKPASLMNLNKVIGSLNEGGNADISIFSLENKKIIFSDTEKNTRIGTQLLVPQLTICKGEIVYKNIAY